MASVRVKFRPSTVSDNPGSIYYQVIHERKVRQVLSPYHIYPHEWDSRTSSIAIASGGKVRPAILTLQENIHNDLERFGRIIRKLDSRKFSYSADDIVEMYTYYSVKQSLFVFMEEVISNLRENGNIRTAETYISALSSFKNYRNNEDIMLESLSPEVMQGYESWLKRRGLTMNTISFYSRILRATYNRAVEQELIDDRFPFKHVYTGVDKTVKRALPLPIIKKIKTLDLRGTPSLDYARDMFMLSFYMRGMSFVDMAFLRRSDLSNGHITYRRRKTGQKLLVGWTSEMQAIVDKYPLNATNYLLPIIKRAGCNERYVYRNVNYNINHSLKKIATMLNINMPLTLYVARHSWASAAKSKGIPLSVISEGMGHESESTTRIYLASLDTAVVDRANGLIIKALK